jgi:hypothetical protein
MGERCSPYFGPLLHSHAFHVGENGLGRKPVNPGCCANPYLGAYKKS